jgi:hypothetical protein
MNLDIRVHVLEMERLRSRHYHDAEHVLHGRIVRVADPHAGEHERRRSRRPLAADETQGTGDGEVQIAEGGGDGIDRYLHRRDEIAAILGVDEQPPIAAYDRTAVRVGADDEHTTRTDRHVV